MRKLVETVLENVSTREVFLFRVSCANCEAVYTNRPVRFSKAGVTPTEESKKIIYNALYEQEMNSARHSAIRSIAENLNYCPICKRLICNRCFLICDDLDMCIRCATDLKQLGRPVQVGAAEITTE